MAGIYRICKRFLGDDTGATAIEYGLIVALIVMVVLLGMATLGTALETLFNSNASRAGAVFTDAGTKL